MLALTLNPRERERETPRLSLGAAAAAASLARSQAIRLVYAQTRLFPLAELQKGARPVNVYFLMHIKGVLQTDA